MLGNVLSFIQVVIVTKPKIIFGDFGMKFWKLVSSYLCRLRKLLLLDKIKDLK